jgi:ABC-type uncharacterized transport system fused permease/ATPase subunit
VWLSVTNTLHNFSELWPSWGGKIVKPPRGKLFYIPQRPYMTLGSLRDQIIYPHTFEEMKRRGKTDHDLFNFLDIVQLRSLVQQREKGLDSIEDVRILLIYIHLDNKVKFIQLFILFQ